MRLAQPWLMALAAVAALLGACAEAPVKQAETRDLVFPSPPDEPRFVFERSIYSSKDVLEVEKDSVLRQMLTGEGGEGEGLAKPYGVAVHQGRMYVSDPVAGAVKLFDIPARKFSVVGPDEQEPLVQPLGIDVDAQSNLYVVDGVAKDIKIYDAQGKFVRKLGGPKMFHRPSGIASTPDGTRVYVVDTGGVGQKEEHRIRVFDARTSAHLFDFGKRGTGNGEFNLPRDIAVGADGQLYVVDSGNFRIQIFDRDGKFQRTFGTLGRQYGNFARPREIAVDAQGNIYVSDAAFGNMQIFDSQGQLLMFIGTRSERDQPARYMLISGVAVDRDGRIYTTDEFFRRVDVFRPARLNAGEGFVPKPAPAATATAEKKGK